MGEDKKYVRHTYFVHQYEQEEAFLSEMAREGWHFVNLHKGIPTKYEFIKGEPVDYIYQLDYVTTEEDTEDYHQLFSDAGWDEVFSWIGFYGATWYYFRRIRTNDKETKIFTDAQSKYQMYEKLWKKYSLFLFISLYLEFNGIRSFVSILERSGFTSVLGILAIIFSSIFLVFSLFIIYMIVAIIREKNKIRQEIEEHL